MTGVGHRTRGTHLTACTGKTDVMDRLCNHPERGLPVVSMSLNHIELGMMHAAPRRLKNSICWRSL